ncbi:helix-hairpin-helix domain-containing protein [candidate division WOR-3 bacterium]|nr:helix-hairpin-helix domain-containing protein [candidate division WOR-3 bacterium]
MRKLLLLCILIGICWKLIGFEVDDSISVNYEYYKKVNINKADLPLLLSIPYIDMEIAHNIISAKKKWGIIIDYRMLRYIIGDEIYEKIRPFISYKETDVGLCFSARYKYINENLFSLISLIDRNRYRIAIYSEPNDINSFRFFANYNYKYFTFLSGSFTIYNIYSYSTDLRSKSYNIIRFNRNLNSTPKGGIAFITKLGNFESFLSLKGYTIGNDSSKIPIYFMNYNSDKYVTMSGEILYKNKNIFLGCFISCSNNSIRLGSNESEVKYFLGVIEKKRLYYLEIEKYDKNLYKTFVYRHLLESMTLKHSVIINTVLPCSANTIDIESIMYRCDMKFSCLSRKHTLSYHSSYSEKSYLTYNSKVTNRIRIRGDITNSNYFNANYELIYKYYTYKTSYNALVPGIKFRIFPYHTISFGIDTYGIVDFSEALLWGGMLYSSYLLLDITDKFNISIGTILFNTKDSNIIDYHSPPGFIGSYLYHGSGISARVNINYAVKRLDIKINYEFNSVKEINNKINVGLKCSF